MDAYLIVAGDFVDHGGMDRANLELARYVAGRGHPVHVVAHRISARLAQTPRIRAHLVPRPLGLGLLGERGLDLVGSRLAARLPKGTRVVVNGGNCALEAVNWVHFVHRAEGASSTETSMRSQMLGALARWSEGRALSRARLIIANSERTRTDLLMGFRMALAPIQTVYCGIDSTEFFPVESRIRASSATRLGFRAGLRRIVFVGALGNERKGLRTLLEAWRSLAARWAEFEVVIVGSGRMLATLKKEVATTNLSDRVHFLGQREDVAEILKSSDVLVAPASYEPYGLNIAEALATGLPVIATVTAGASEMVNGELRGLLLSNPRSTGELLGKLSAWRDGMDRYRQAAVDASAKLRAHTWDAMSAEMYRLIEGAYS